jgi:hypothetical protein
MPWLRRNPRVPSYQACGLLARFRPESSEMTCPKYPRSLLLLFVLLLMIPAGTIGLASPLAQAPLTRKAQVVSGACQEPQIGQL